MQNNLIYLDYNATTPVDKSVIDQMLPYFYEKPGNAASRSHPFGWEAEEAVKISREKIAKAINVLPKEIVFTSGATESINLAIKGVYESYYRKGNHIITVKTEHKAVLDVCENLEKQGGKVTYLNVDHDGLIRLEELQNAITDETVLVSIMWANNETGVIQPMLEIGQICEKKGVLLMSDATQAVGKVEVDPKAVGVHLLTFSGHKLYGPKGIGGLFINSSNPRVVVKEQIHGGGHEKGRRSGTLNVPGIVGMASAIEMCTNSMKSESQRLSKLRDHLESELLKLEEVYVNGSKNDRLPHVTNLEFRYVESEALIATFNQKIAVATGSACTSASLDPSHVIMAMGRDEENAYQSVRFSLGRYTTKEEIEETISLVKKGVEKLRSESPVWEMFKEGML